MCINLCVNMSICVRECACVRMFGLISISVCARVHMHVRVLVRSGMYASPCMCAMASMCSWFGTGFGVLVLRCMCT